MYRQLTDSSRLLRFVLVGGSSALLYFGLLFVLVEGLAVQVVLASTIVCVAAMCYNYLMHYHWTFASDAPHGMVLVRYLLMSAGGILLNGLIMHFGVMLSAVHYMVVQFVAAAALVCWNFCVSYFWVFRKR
jgi:putative flippase GtrA